MTEPMTDMAELVAIVTPALDAMRALALPGTPADEAFDTIESFVAVAMVVMSKTKARVVKAASVEVSLQLQFRAMDLEHSIAPKPTAIEAIMAEAVPA